MIEFITWKWKPPRPYRSEFAGESVNVLARMIARHYPLPHRFSCLTDDATGIDEKLVRIIPLWDTYAQIPNPSNGNNPSCYRRLKLFSAEAREIIGERIVSLDMDMVICGDLRPLFAGGEDFKIWGGQRVDHVRPGNYNWYNGSLMMLRAGARRQVWEKFDPAHSPRRAHLAGCRGSDQGWIAHCLGPNEAMWNTADGVYSYRIHVAPAGGALPENARVVAFHGKHDPWDPAVQKKHPWVREHWR